MRAGTPIHFTYHNAPRADQPNSVGLNALCFCIPFAAAVSPLFYFFAWPSFPALGFLIEVLSRFDVLAFQWFLIFITPIVILCGDRSTRARQAAKWTLIGFVPGAAVAVFLLWVLMGVARILTGC